MHAPALYMRLLRRVILVATAGATTVNSPVRLVEITHLVHSPELKDSVLQPSASRNLLDLLLSYILTEVSLLLTLNKKYI